MTRVSAHERRVLVGSLLDQRRTAGLPAEEVSRAAKQVGIAKRTLWRWLAGGLPGMSPRSRYHLTEADRDAYAAARGNVAAAWRAGTGSFACCCRHSHFAKHGDSTGRVAHGPRRRPGS